MILGGFAGPGGWAEGLRALGLSEVGLELDESACRTRGAAGHATIRCDVTQYPTGPFAGRLTGKIDSPPCQGFSRAGKRGGIGDLEYVHQAVDDLARGRDTRAGIASTCTDPRSILAAEPMRWHHDLRPEWIAMEQVPDVLPLWRQYAQILRDWGYSTWCGILNAADYGVPQTRRRAILIASRVRTVAPPAPTHTQDPQDDLFGESLPRWVSMADALGWGATDRVSPTVTAGGGKTGGPEPYPTQARQALLDAQARGAWALRNGNQPNAAVRPAEEPAPTMAFGNNSARIEWVLHTNRGQEPDGTRQTPDPHGAPAPALTAKSGGQWVLKSDEAPDAVRITVAEAAVLQSFPADHPFQGTKTKQFEQVGNAWCPRAAAAVVAAAVGIPAEAVAS